MTLEKAIAYIEDDELVEVTPKAIRLRKKCSTPTSASARNAEGSGGGVRRARIRLQSFARRTVREQRGYSAVAAEAPMNFPQCARLGHHCGEKSTPQIDINDGA